MLIEADWDDPDFGDGRALLEHVHERATALGARRLQHHIDEPRVVWHASRGAITLRVAMGGQEAHVGQAHLGENAFEKMIRVAEPLATLAHELLQRRTIFR